MASNAQIQEALAIKGGASVLKYYSEIAVFPDGTTMVLRQFCTNAGPYKPPVNVKKKEKKEDYSVTVDEVLEL